VSTTTLTATGGETSVVTQAASISGTFFIFVNGLLLPPPYTSVGLVTTIAAATSGDIFVVTYRTTTASPAASSLSNLVADAISLWPKLVEWFECNETSGSTITGSHAATVLTLTGSPSLNQTHVRSGGGASAHFGSGQYGYQASPLSAMIAAPKQSVFSWVRPATVPTGSGNTAVLVTDFSGSGGTTHNLQYWLGIDTSSKVQAGWAYGSQVNNFNSSTSTLTAGTNYFVGYTVDHTTRDLEIYIDSTLDRALTYTSGTEPTGGSITSINLGSLQQYPTLFYSDAYLQGTILCDDVITTAEQAYLYNSGAGKSYAQFKSDSGH